MSRSQVRPTRTSLAAVAALFCGLLALALSWLPLVGVLAFPFGLAAFACAVVALRHTRSSSIAGRGLAITGLLFGAVGLVIATWLLIVFLLGFQGPAFEQDVNEFLEPFET